MVEVTFREIGEGKMAVGDLTSKKRLKREGRTQGQVEGAVKDARSTESKEMRS